jgi:hypothetical protein
MSESPETVVIEEIEIEKPSSGAWFALGAIAIIIAVIFGVRAVQKKRSESVPAVPSDVPPANA